MTTQQAPAWKSYCVGATIVADGAEYTITNAWTTKSNDNLVRQFTLTSADGVEVTKTSRALTKWINGDQASAGLRPSLAEAIAEAISPFREAAGVNREEVAEIVREELRSGATAREIVVTRLDGQSKNVGVQHSSFEALLRAVSARENVWLPGPAGSGKTSAAHAVADSLTLPFYAVSVGPQTSQTSLLGYYDAGGNYVTTQLRQAFEHGGVFLLDEVDAGSPAVLVVINSLLANGHASFPDKVVEKHSDFVLIAAGNTLGQGADAQYVGRQKLDEATLDRFTFLRWGYDPALVASHAGLPEEIFANLPRPKAWQFEDCSSRQAVRDRREEYGRRVAAIWYAVDGFGKSLRLLVGPRAVFHGLALIEAGFRVEDAIDCCVWKGCDRDTRAKVEAVIASR